MPRICTKVSVPGGGVAIITTSTNVHPNEPCGFCGNKHDVLCDFPIHKGKDTKRYTCSRRVCKGCRMFFDEGGKVDFCPIHGVQIHEHQLAPRLVPLLLAGDAQSHKVALDLIDQTLGTKTAPSAIVLSWVPFKAKDARDYDEFFTERAAIFEFEGGHPRRLAERMALALAGDRPNGPNRHQLRSRR